MPIKKRLTEKQRLTRSLPKGWKSALRHPLLKALTHADHFNPTPINVSKAISTVSSWRGASDVEKVFVLALDLVMEKAYGEGVLSESNYNRLWDHLVNNEHKLDTWARQTFLWDIYHDHYGLVPLENGALELPKPKIVIKKKVRKKRILKRR